MKAEPLVVRIVIADDQALFRSGLAHLLQEDPRVDVVGEASNGEEAVRLAVELSPDLVLMDLKMPRLDGVEATQRLAREAPSVKVLILTSFETDGYVLQALRSGASGYLLKDSERDAIVNSILAVAAGERVIASAVANRVVDMLTGNTSGKEYYDGLTRRELEILRLMAAGMANKQIAYQLKISEKTARNHVSNMYEKLNIHDRAQVALYAVRKGLVEL